METFVVLSSSSSKGAVAMNQALRLIIAQRIEELDTNEHFNLPALLGEEWPKDQGAARQLGKDFRANLHDFLGVEDEGRDGENLRWYRRT